MASVPCNYEINVALKTPSYPNGKHYCKIELPDSFEEEAEKKLNLIRQRLGKEFHVSMIHWNCLGTRKEEWK